MRSPSRHITLLVILMIFLIITVSCKKEGSVDNNMTGNSDLKIEFKAVIDNDVLIIGKSYQNGFAEDYSVKTFKFYIHGVELSDSRTNSTVKLDKNDHYLVNTNDPSAASVILHVSPSAYDGISFIVGVDSIRNTSGAQTGALDPAQGMFWTWSTGYIMAKLEGNSPLATTPNNVIEYHIGGFKGGESVLRRVSLKFPSGLVSNVKPGRQSTVTITADVNRWFTNSVRISQTPVAMAPGKLAMQIADNYAHMFTVVDIVNE
jgi:hypothetical protein